MLFHCIYTSVQAKPLSTDEVTQLVRHSRESNAEHDLTGILLHVGDCFFQVLEGDPDTIDQLYQKILVDPRHTRITRIIFETIPRRYFSDSNMSLLSLSPENLSQVLNYPDPEAREHLLADLDEGRAKKLLRAFSDGRWRSTPLAHRLPEASLA